jgi:hypothetical protein
MAKLERVFSYEIRLYRADGKTSLVYDFLCPDDDTARTLLSSLEDYQFDGYEIWRGMVLIATGIPILLH